MLFPVPTPPSVPPRVVITGAGIVTALGIGWRKNADGFRTGQTAFRPVTAFDVSRQRVRLAATVDLPRELPSTRLSPKLTGRLDRAAQMLLVAAHEAVSQARWQASPGVPLVLGTTSGGMSEGEDYFRQAIQNPSSRHRQPTRAVHYQALTQARCISEAFDIRGPITVIANACASGANAIGHAYELLQCGRANRVLAGGYDALSLLVFSGFDSLQALSPTLCRPFDATRDGLALGEGAAVMTLESLESANRRHATILGEIIGYGSAVDRYHLTQPHPQGDAALETMTTACAAAGINALDVGYVNAHGTGTPLNDSAEAMAINRWAGNHAANVPVSSTKASIGHLLGAAGAVEALVCLMTLREQWLPPQVRTTDPDPICRFPLVSRPTNATLKIALSNSFGFGGANATLILRRWI